MAILRLPTSTLQAMLNDIVTKLGASATCQFRTGAPPAAVTDAATGTLLGTLSFAATPGVVSGLVLTMNPFVRDESADAGGVAGYVRAIGTGSLTVFDADVTATGGGGVVQMATTTITAGLPIEIASFAIAAQQLG